MAQGKIGISGTAVVLLLLGAGPADAQVSEEGRFEFGTAVGLTANQPPAFEPCGDVDIRGTVSLRGSYPVNRWLEAELQGAAYHSSAGAFRCPRPTSSLPRRSYPLRVEGGSYISTTARVVARPIAPSGGLRPILAGGIGRIWSKGLTYPEFGIGAEIPGDDVSLRVEAAGQWLSLPFDSVTVSGERIPRTDVHLPLLFRVGVGWRPW